ncbi:endo alpha-1,4 polygalactosaminidase [Methylobacterium oxalidis]|uniref:Uncharacterized protein n=1 Tax=Methylobacterium oxalidis TaxID=944322 RepID=A0A512J613_9HYPH|nr:endo alpha-1,4 polygalactosaminidase [Methylobacterium oxalidis]GEP05299.1 hypothetical protein MOX02_33370 [Methylobacterium oxalidis]GJE30000.1 hypothetical protein LDDCCGHA_0163 [Methylobacterium oxalidis]GLS64657.1 hypothetical protein GCM10007888_30380 [Methylobacterium oxalidis]
MPKTGMYVLQGVTPSQIAAAPFDVKVIDIYNDAGQTFTPAEVKQMGGGPGNALLLGYFSIGEAETYRDYFKTIPSAALGPENPQWKGNYEVAFWTPEWKAVATAYIDRMLAAGYDGVYFDVVDEYQTSWAKSHAPGGAAGAEQAMVDLIKYLRDYAQVKHPGFKVWVNNAEELLTHPGYLDTVDGMFKENLFYTDSGQKQPASETSYSMGLLQKAINAGKDVISIEYVTGAQKVADVHALNDKYGLSSYVADLDLNGVDTEGVRPGQVIHDDGLGATQPSAPAPAPLIAPPAEPEPEQPHAQAAPSSKDGGEVSASYRFYDASTGGHFYTTSTAEKAQILKTLPSYQYEGVGWATPQDGPNTIDVFRFYDTKTGQHFFTTDAAERDTILKTLPSYHYEGVAFEAYASAAAAGAGGVTLERFYNTQTGLHHYTANAAEAAAINQGSAGPGWVDEGHAFTVHIPTGGMLHS